MAAPDRIRLARVRKLTRDSQLLYVFGLVWGAMFTFGPLLLLVGFALNRKLSAGVALLALVMLCLGLAALIGSLKGLLARESLWLDAARGVVERRIGFGSGQALESWPLNSCDHVRVRRAKNGITVQYYEVALCGPGGTHRSLGTAHAGRPDALATALQVARATGLPLDEELESGRLRRHRHLPQAQPVTPIAWWRRPAAIALLAANLVPLAGVLYAGWQALPLLLLYALESAIIGLYALARALMAQTWGEGSTGAALWLNWLVLCALFLVIFVPFIGAYAAFLIGLFGGKEAGDLSRLDWTNPLAALALMGAATMRYGLHWGLLALLVSHGVSFLLDYVRPRAYEKAVVSHLMGKPFQRILVLQAVVMLGGLLHGLLSAPLVALALLVALKTGVDLAAYLREQRLATLLDAEGGSA